MNKLTIKLKTANEKFAELKSQFLEMGQLKSDFDIEKFTCRKEGHFIAHNFHFLMRQYHLALYELRRMLCDHEEKSRKLIEFEIQGNKGTQKTWVLKENGREEVWVDIEIQRSNNEMDLLEIGMVNKLRMCEYFEKCRLKLIELNQGKPPTNKQYQAEVPQYWKWFLANKALTQAKQAKTGIHEGVWENINLLEQPVLINENFQVLMLNESGILDLKTLEREVEIHKKIPERIKKILEAQAQELIQIQAEAQENLKKNNE